MKTILILLTSLLIATASFANDGNQSKNCQFIGNTNASPSGLQTNLFQNANGRVTLIFVQPSESQVAITVEDNERNVLFKETVTADGARQHFSMKEKGTYFFTLRANGECFVKTVEIN